MNPISFLLFILLFFLKKFSANEQTQRVCINVMDLLCYIVIINFVDHELQMLRSLYYILIMVLL